MTIICISDAITIGYYSCMSILVTLIHLFHLPQSYSYSQEHKPCILIYDYQQLISGEISFSLILKLANQNQHL